MGVSIEVYRARVGLYGHVYKGAGSSSCTKPQHGSNPFGLSMVAISATLLCILLLMAGVEPNPGPDNSYKCKFCSLLFNTTSKYSQHMMVHSHWKNFSIQCCFCQRFFKNAVSFDSHVTRFHRDMRTKAKDSSNRSSSSAMFTCPIDDCKKILDSREVFKIHMTSHLQKGSSFQCGLGACKSTINKVRQFQNHMSRSHPDTEMRGTGSSPLSQRPIEESFETFSLSEEINDNESTTDVNEMDLGESSLEAPSEDLYPENVIKDDIARFYLKLEGELTLATSTVQEISLEIKRLTEYSHHCLKSTLKQQLNLLDLTEPVKQSIMHTTFKSDPVFNVHHKDYDADHLGTHYLRNKYWHKAFPFVEPKEFYFGRNEAGKKRIAHYISIKQTLEVLLRDEDVKKMVLESFEREIGTSSSSVLQDYFNGSGYVAHQCKHHEGHKCLQLLLFEDAFEFSPFGPAAGVHKPIGFYYSLGNLSTEVRSKVDLILLAYMILEKDTRPTQQEEIDGKDILKEALTPLLEELELLKTEGIEINGEKIPVCLLYLIGDSLGQHTMGRYVQNFNGEFFCRFCEISKTQFLNKPYEVKPFRTPQKYDEAVQAAKEIYERRKKIALQSAKKRAIRQARKKAQAGSSTSHAAGKKLLPSKTAYKKLVAASYRGVKYRPSPFNSDKLKFHVSDPALPSCLMHDLHEGVIKCVLARVLEYFIENKGWFDLTTLNRRIKGFKCKGTDARDPPQPLKSIKQLSGRAYQNFNFLRLLPFIIGDLIQDKEDPVWKLYLLLKEICEYVCAPKISMEQLPYLKAIIRAYLCSLKTLQENLPDCLIPKQHFLAHFPDIIEIFGPLSRVCTNRFESAHIMFKNAARACKNFINITYTLARKYMCKFAYDNISGLLPQEINYKQSHILTLPSLPQEKLAVLPEDFDIRSYEFLSSVVVQGTAYETNSYLILDSFEDTTDLLVGRIDSIMLDSANQISFILEEKVASNTMDGYYKIENASDPKFRHMFHKDLLDYYPLPAYNFGGNLCITLKHSVLCM